MELSKTVMSATPSPVVTPNFLAPPAVYNAIANTGEAKVSLYHFDFSIQFCKGPDHDRRSSRGGKLCTWAYLPVLTLDSDVPWHCRLVVLALGSLPLDLLVFKR